MVHEDIVTGHNNTSQHSSRLNFKSNDTTMSRRQEIAEYCQDRCYSCWRKKQDYIVLLLLLIIATILIAHVVVQAGRFKEWQEQIRLSSDKNETFENHLSKSINKSIKKAFRQWKEEALQLLITDYLSLHRMWPRLPSGECSENVSTAKPKLITTTTMTEPWTSSDTEDSSSSEKSSEVPPPITEESDDDDGGGTVFDRNRDEDYLK